MNIPNRDQSQLSWLALGEFGPAALKPIVYVIALLRRIPNFIKIR